MTIAVLAGAIANKAGNGGNLWSRLGWASGLTALGFDVWLVERLDLPEVKGPLDWTEKELTRHGWAGRYCAIDASGDTLAGEVPVHDVLAEAQLIVNLGAHLSPLCFPGAPQRWVLVDDDPGFTQVWAAQGIHPSFEGHGLHLTLGSRIGQPGCPIPTAGVTWHATRPPVHLADWTAREGRDRRRLTTVASWRPPFGAVAVAGKEHGVKAHEWRRMLELPSRVDAQFDVALDIAEQDAGDRKALENNSWVISDPRQVAASTDAYQSWVESSGAEFSPAQGVYVGTASGWVSDRTARYLAAGVPAVVQDTGLSCTIPTGDGLLVWSDLSTGAAAVEAVLEDPGRHEAAAKRLAAELFDDAVVAAELCELAGTAP